MPEQIFSTSPIELIFKYGQGNIGYGKGHNLAFFSSKSKFYLVLNPDVYIKEDALTQTW